MSIKTFTGRIICFSLFLLTLNGCYRPPNQLREDKQTFVAGSPGTGVLEVKKNKLKTIITELQRQDIQFVQYGDTTTLIVPTDRYFVFNSPRLKDECYSALNNIVKLISCNPCSVIYVAGFTDDVGSRYHKKMLSQARAEAMLTFLWGNGIQAQRMHAEGYEDKYAVGDNRLIRGSAYNRRIEIQIVKTPLMPVAQVSHAGMK